MANKETALSYTEDLESHLFSLYPELQKIEPQCWFKLISQSLFFHAPPQAILHTLPGPYNHFLLLIEGSSRVFQSDENKREVTFYRNHPGDICPHNLDTLFNAQQSDAYVQADTAIHALQVSSKAFHLALQESDIFRRFIFSRMSSRFNELTSTLESTVFKNLDSRLCLLLNKLFKQSVNNSLSITHQQLANEIGTTREVVSRSLKTLEKKGYIKMNRGQLIMMSEDKLTPL
ncbi:MAG: Crp/Fnr family transcriptional regulator [Gammaproteobacteria bacterium]|nr:Crp/Fnr family transcriptional regulator [Gammaproteobacteria bacterium]